MPHFSTDSSRQFASRIGGLGLVALLAGCSAVPVAERDPGDRFESGNREVYVFNEELDKAVLKPAANAYVDTVPEPARNAASRFFDNLLYVDTILNGFLQGKIEQGFSDLARFSLNSTLGLLGFFDVATPMGLPRHDEDFGQTLAVWGAGSGEYLVYPVLGPSGVRDTGGIVVSLLTNPIVYAAAPVAIPLGVLNIIDLRARQESFAQFRDQAALDAYIFTRESYQQNRTFEVYDGNPPRQKLEVFEEITVPAATPEIPAPTGTAGGPDVVPDLAARLN
jgi:phospholipid-binding lipoprotein MlaA